MRLALIGTGKIVKEVLEAVKNIETIELSAIWTRPHSLEVAGKLAGDYKIASVSTDYAKLLKREDVDFVYIGLINSVHYEYAKQALEAGKHVIMEKPFCATEAETMELTKLAVEKNLFLFDAVSFLYMPNFFFLEDHIKKLAKSSLYRRTIHSIPAVTMTIEMVLYSQRLIRLLMVEHFMISISIISHFVWHSSASRIPLPIRRISGSTGWIRRASCILITRVFRLFARVRRIRRVQVSSSCRARMAG